MASLMAKIDPHLPTMNKVQLGPLSIKPLTLIYPAVMFFVWIFTICAMATNIAEWDIQGNKGHAAPFHKPDGSCDAQKSHLGAAAAFYLMSLFFEMATIALSVLIAINMLPPAVPLPNFVLAGATAFIAFMLMIGFAVSAGYYDQNLCGAGHKAPSDVKGVHSGPSVGFGVFAWLLTIASTVVALLFSRTDELHEGAGAYDAPSNSGNKIHASTDYIPLADQQKQQPASPAAPPTPQSSPA